jgi:Domain of unknown function (DUF4157)
MYAPKVIKPQTKTAADSSNKLALQRSLFAARPFGGRAVPENMTAREAPRGVSWDFSKIPIFPPARADRLEAQSSLSTPHLPGIVQPKLVVGEVNDPLEHEADRVADQVMLMPDSELSITPVPAQLSRKCAACEDQERRQLQTKPIGVPVAASSEAPGFVHEVLRAPGRPLDAASRAFFEPRFGRDFSRIELHTDERASISAKTVSARAFTVGGHIVFGAGEWSPTTDRGRWLLAHELAHATQQNSGTIRLQPQAPMPLADPDALAAEISTLLHTPDPVAGMRTGEAIQRLQGLDWTQLLSVLRGLRARNASDPPIIQGEAPLLISVAAETVSLEVATRTEPEVLARYRSRVQQLSPPDQGAVIATYPAAAVPADPAVPAGGLVPPPGAPAGIPGPLLETLYHSYARRQAGLPGSDGFLANAFWGGRPADFWQALTQMGTALDVVRRIYTRWTATTVPWAFADALYNTWGGTSDGFDFACHDRSGLEAALNGASAFCEDHVGGLYHLWVEGTTPCWREIINGSPGLHVCTGGGRTTVHIDPHQVVSGTWPGGFCSYDVTGSVVDHFKDLGWW